MRPALIIIWVLLAVVRIQATPANASPLLATGGARLLLPVVADATYTMDVTVHNSRDTSQDVLIAVNAEIFGSTETVSSARITVDPFSTTTLEDMAPGQLFSGLGWIEVRGVDRDSTIVDPAANLRAVLRAYAPAPEGRGTKSVVSEGINLDALAASGKRTARGMRLDRNFGTEVAIINLEATASTFLITVSGPRETITRTYLLLPHGMVNVPFPNEDLGPVTASVETIEPSTPSRWLAFGASFDSMTGDRWMQIANRD